MNKRIRNFAALFFLIAAMAAAAGCGQTGASNGGTTAGTEVGGVTQMAEAEASADTEEVNATGAEGYYIIMEIDKTDQSIRFYNTALERLQIYNYDSGTYYYNRYGGLKSLAQFAPGDIVALKLESDSYAIDVMQDSDQCWELDDVTDYVINTDIEGQEYIQIGSEKYKLSSLLTVFDGEEQSSLNSISDEDVLTVKGCDKRADVLIVSNRTGYLQLTQVDNYSGGYYTIGNFQTGPITEEGQVIPVKSGTFLFAAAGNGYGGSQEITVTSGEVTQVDLSAIDQNGGKICTMTVTIEPEWADLYIDGAKTDWLEPFEVSYGTHSLQIIASGYEDYTKILVVNSATAKLDFDVTENVSDDTTSDDEDSTAAAGDESETDEETTDETTDTDPLSSTDTDPLSSSSTSTTSKSKLSSDSSSSSTSSSSSLSSSDIISTLSSLLGTSSSTSDSTSTYSILNSLVGSS